MLAAWSPTAASPRRNTQRVMLAEHRPPRGQRTLRPDPHPEEQAIVTVAPELADYVAGLKQRSRKVITLALRQLLRLVREYPREPLLGAVREAARYGLRPGPVGAHGPAPRDARLFLAERRTRRR